MVVYIALSVYDESCEMKVCYASVVCRNAGVQPSPTAGDHPPWRVGAGGPITRAEEQGLNSEWCLWERGLCCH